MKTKTKLLALLEIAIVLCLVFLVALPTVAAEQNQEMQEISASEITTTSEDDFVLDIYGNANEDDTIDMRDLTYVKLIFFGKKPETELADAKYDGKINPMDFIQIKLIIVGKEKELTVIDGREKTKTFKLPIKRIIAPDDGQGEPLKVLGAEDLVVGVGSSLADHYILLPELSKLPLVGTWKTCDYEKVISLKPDLFFTYVAGRAHLGAEEKLEPLGVQVLRLDCYAPTEIPEDITKLGYLLGKKDMAEEFLTFRKEHIDKIKARTEGLLEEDKPRVFILSRWPHLGMMTVTKNTREDDVISLAGGINIAHDLGDCMWPVVDIEWIIGQNPDIIMVCPTIRFGLATTTELKEMRDELMNKPGWENIKAVKNGNVYVTSYFAPSGLQEFVWATYCAKWFHPELFEDLDPQAIHQEYIDRFIRIDYDIKKGTFVYPEPS